MAGSADFSNFVAPICALQGKLLPGETDQARPVRQSTRTSGLAAQNQPMQRRPAAGL
jgi:hypothetical protein